MFWMPMLLFALATTNVNAKYASACTTSDKQPGRCMPVKSCKTIYNFLNKSFQEGGAICQQDQIKLASSFCGNFKTVPHVCCPETEIQLNVDGLNILKQNACGIRMVNRIANGETASIFKFPWMALLKYEDQIEPFKCGGTLISDQYVLTAAHCIKGKEHLLTHVRLGEYQISSARDCTNFSRKNECAHPVEDIEVEELIPHEDFEVPYDDIALIKLSRKVKFKRHIKPICLPIYEELISKSHDDYVISGWGKTANGASSDVLMTAYVSRVNHESCENQLRKYNLRASLNYGHICAGGKNFTDSCRGDSGGPLGYTDFYDEQPRFIQFGIVSIGLYHCGVVNVPSVYTNVSHYMQWITDNLQGDAKKIKGIASRLIAKDSCTTPTLENGYCVPYKDCPFVNDLVKNYGSTEAIPRYYLNYIFKSKCSQGKQPIHLCCILPNNYVRPTATPTPVNPTSKSDPTLTEDLDYRNDFISQFNPQGLSILSTLSCGSSDGNKVAGGNETDLAEYPWMALLRYDSPGDEFKCGGSLISNRYVLTATHCVNKPVYPAIGVRLGEHDLSTNPDCRQKFRKNVCNPVVEDFGIEKIIIHPKYNERRRINDIALVKLDREVQFKKHIKPVCLPITTPSFEVSSNEFTIAGWGTTENNTKSLVLLKAPVSGQVRSVCQNKFSAFNIEINQKHICAGDLQTGRDSCKGDSGGPLVAFNTYTDTKRFVQYGIVASGGIACNLEQKFPGIYTNVLTFLPWITNNIVE